MFDGSNVLMKKVAFRNIEFLMLLNNSGHDLATMSSLFDIGIYEKSTTIFIANYLKNGDTFIDVGANNGYFSLLAAGIVGSTGRIISIEPQSESYARLVKNIQINNIRNIVPFRLSASNTTQSMSIFFPEGGSGLTSMLNNKVGLHSEKVMAYPLDLLIKDSYLNNKTIIKIDVEGYEHEVLQGASNLICQNDIVIVFEYFKYAIFNRNRKYDSVIDYLHNMNFEIHLLSNDGSLGKIIRNHLEIPYLVTNLVAIKR